MTRRKLRVAIVQIEGTNNDGELAVALKSLGASPEVVHLKQLERRDVERDRFRSLDEFGMVMFPGGFSAGDHVRAGAIFAARVRAAIGQQLEDYIRSGRLVGGLCNGFQVLTELGLLPGRGGGRLGPPEAALMSNDSGRYECRPTFLRWEGGQFRPMSKIPPGELFLFPSGHAEGKLVLSGAPGARLPELEENGQVLFRWSKPDGSPATYPWNPNGSEGDVAGLTSPDGNVFGLMPHPERHFFRLQNPEWTRSSTSEGFGDGHRFLETLVDFAQSAG